MEKSLKLIYLKRRNNLVNNLPENSLVIIPNKHHAIRSNDVEYRFKPDSDFYYLTGFDEPSSICVIKKDKKKYSYILFVEEKNKDKEIWIGKKAGLQGAKLIYQAHESYPINTFFEKFKFLINGTENLFYPIGKDKELDLKINALFNETIKLNRLGKTVPKTISDPRGLIHNLRLYKDEHELYCMKKAASISRDAHILAMAYARPGMYEYEIEALLEYKFRSSGAIGSAYTSIVGAGENATVLHYINNNKKIKNGDLILIDAGCEYENYASDLTRTFPANKKFTTPQKEIYEIVLKSQLAVIKMIKPGITFKNTFDKSVSVIVDGLKELKLLKGSKEEIIKHKKYKKFFMHNIGHWLGLDVHDAGSYIDKKNNSIKLKSNMVMTVEPGIYIGKDLDDVPKHFLGIGVRIEDDVLLTKKGNIVLTEGTPKTIKEIEAFMS